MLDHSPFNNLLLILTCLSFVVFFIAIYYSLKLIYFKKFLLKEKPDDIQSVDRNLKLVPLEIQKEYNHITRKTNFIIILLLIVSIIAFYELFHYQLLSAFILMVVIFILLFFSFQKLHYLYRSINDGYQIIRSGMIYYMYIFTSNDLQQKILTYQKRQLISGYILIFFGYTDSRITYYGYFFLLPKKLFLK
ncbi:hypothetical protein MEPL4_4c02820 [Melissococcus plutonius]|uniref:hypothetical protein n=1 Tax=Melissococcus plutonius TaxID=33970 RepID=UPI00065DDFBB|nr:hypothetical protein [Melissococcus plutonius]KMT25438.1 hypothetical protein MEPL2_2c10110 [Melissococcus plutonius]KMT29084.1 hypothetical protein MEPL4_4c02820 [Melissococcus plutonius]KMT35658.1 hypothetical protein MEPL10_6c01140 [Melissococcus plutonius]KMT35765.1 hypothetical protein MEPL9_4c01140 [Melissococcus plutonius]KMT38624.1 hypothetical protein MEPL11_5c00460 [Melissococcus plutonius]